MHQKRIGVLTIGQSPRPDLVSPIRELLPNLSIVQAGALDSLAPEDLPEISESAYPLVTRMQNGETVMVEERYITPKLQQAIENLENKRISAILVLCAGTFRDLTSTLPLLVPFKIGCGVLKTLQIKSIGIITPVPLQEKPILKRWLEMGFQPHAWTADLRLQDVFFYQQLSEWIHTNNLSCLVLDYVGHPVEQVIRLQESIEIPVIDLGHLAVRMLASII